MTLQQLKYAVETADRGSISEAAKSLFIAQPSLSRAIKELEEEIGLSLFARTGRGIIISPEGHEFLGYARQVVQQAELLEEKFLSGKPQRQRFSVSTHHYSFAANAFVDLIKEFGGDEYEFTLRETKTYEIIRDVRTLRSEIGIIYLSRFNEQVLGKLLRESNLTYDRLFTAKPHVFISRTHPLAQKASLRVEELEDYPCLNFDQGEHNSFYFSEEILTTLSHKKSIVVSDRAAVINMMIGVNGYLFATGVFPSYLHGNDIIALPLDGVDEEIRVGVITHKDYLPSRLGQIFLEALRRIADSINEI